MKIERYRDGEKILNRPSSKNDGALFKHCANGKIAVPTRVYNKEVEPMLIAHGVTFLEVVDNT